MVANAMRVFAGLIHFGKARTMVLAVRSQRFILLREIHQLLRAMTLEGIS